MLGLYVKHAYKHAYKACLGLGWWGQVGWLVTTSRYKQAQASKHAKTPSVRLYHQGQRSAPILLFAQDFFSFYHNFEPLLEMKSKKFALAIF